MFSFDKQKFITPDDILKSLNSKKYHIFKKKCL